MKQYPYTIFYQNRSISVEDTIKKPFRFVFHPLSTHNEEAVVMKLDSTEDSWRDGLGTRMPGGIYWRLMPWKG